MHTITLSKIWSALHHVWSLGGIMISLLPVPFQIKLLRNHSGHAQTSSPLQLWFELFQQRVTFTFRLTLPTEHTDSDANPGKHVLHDPWSLWQQPGGAYSPTAVGGTDRWPLSPYSQQCQSGSLSQLSHTLWYVETHKHRGAAGDSGEGGWSGHSCHKISFLDAQTLWKPHTHTHILYIITCLCIPERSSINWRLLLHQW